MPEPNRIDSRVLDPLLTVREGASVLQVSIPTFWRWVAQGALPKPVKLGRMSRWPQSELLDFIERAKARRAAE
jgi:excisionase family DNA binding protein